MVKKIMFHFTVPLAVRFPLAKESGKVIYKVCTNFIDI